MLQFIKGFANEKKLAKNFGYAILLISALSLIIYLFFRNQISWLGVALASVTVASILAFLAFLYSAYSQNSLTLEKREHQKVLRGLKGEETGFKREVRSVDSKISAAQKAGDKQAQTRASLFEQKEQQFRTRREDIQRHQEEEIAEALSNLQEEYTEQQIQANPIVEAKIPGLGAKTKQLVNNAGMFSIKDIDYSLLVAVRGIGEKTAENIMAWAKDVEQSITYSMPQQIPDVAYKTIAAKYAVKFAEVEADEEKEEKDYASDIDTIEEETAESIAHFDTEKSDAEILLASNAKAIGESDKTLAKFSDITYVSYIKGALGAYLEEERQGGKLGILAALFGLALLAQTASATSSVNSIIVSNIPTATFTSTATTTATVTSTSTVTPTPSNTSTPTITFTPSVTFTPSETPPPSATFPSISQISCIPAGNEREVGYVTSVTDGDTIRVRIDGTIYPVRYIGVDSPEPPLYFSYDATIRNSQLVEGKWVTLVKDTSNTDQFDRLLRYVIVGDIFVNHKLVEEGFATSKRYSPDTSCNGLFDSTQSAAVRAAAGFWRPTSTPPPTSLPTSVPAPTSAISGGGGGDNGGGGSGACDPAYPDVCIPPYPPDLDCGQISFRNFRVTGNDKHGFDGDGDGIGCES